MNFSNSDSTKAHYSHEKDMQRSWNLNLVEPADTFKSDMKVSQSCCTSIMWNSCSTTGAMEIWWLWYLNCAQSVQSVHHHHHQPEPLIDNRSLLLCYLPQIWTQPLECCSRNQSLGNMFFFFCCLILVSLYDGLLLQTSCSKKCSFAYLGLHQWVFASLLLFYELKAIWPFFSDVNQDIFTQRNSC